MAWLIVLIVVIIIILVVLWYNGVLFPPSTPPSPPPGTPGGVPPGCVPIGDLIDEQATRIVNGINLVFRRPLNIALQGFGITGGIPHLRLVDTQPDKSYICGDESPVPNVAVITATVELIINPFGINYNQLDIGFRTFSLTGTLQVIIDTTTQRYRDVTFSGLRAVGTPETPAQAEQVRQLLALLNDPPLNTAFTDLMTNYLRQLLGLVP